MSSLLLWLDGPMQSWGSRSRFQHRETGLVPSKSGVIGLVCAAIGRRRDESLDDLAGLELGVRVDEPGTLECDFQTALEVPRAGNPGSQTVLSHRYYLAGARFLVGLAGPRELLVTVQRGLQAPKWPLFLGRKGFPPGQPPFIAEGLREEDLRSALANYAWPRDRRGAVYPTREAVFEVAAGEGGDLRQDVPISFRLGDRRFGTRRVRSEVLHAPGKEEPDVPEQAGIESA